MWNIYIFLEHGFELHWIILLIIILCIQTRPSRWFSVTLHGFWPIHNAPSSSVCFNQHVRTFIFSIPYLIKKSSHDVENKSSFKYWRDRTAFLSITTWNFCFEIISIFYMRFIWFRWKSLVNGKLKNKHICFVLNSLFGWPGTHVKQSDGFDKCRFKKNCVPAHCMFYCLQT